MGYFQGFVIPVKPDRKDAYRDMAARAAPVFSDCGATRVVECWGDDVPDGKRTDFRRAVNAQEGEAIVFSWVFWPDKATCDAAVARMQGDERMQPGDAPMPFDMKRMIYAGYDAVFDSGDNGRFGFVDGIVGPAPGDTRESFAAYAGKLADFFLAHGASRIVDGWGVDVPDGKITDFKRAVAAEEGEAIVFGWVEWPDKATRDAGFAAMGQDAAMRALPPALDMPRAIFGGFVPILDTDYA